MKSFVLTACLIFFPVATVALAAQLFVPDQNSPPGSSVVVPVQFTAQGDSVSGLQFDIHYEGATVNLSSILGDPGRNSGKRLYVRNLDSGLIRFLVVGLNQSLIGDGALINLFLNVSPDATNGAYALKLSNALAASPEGNSVMLRPMDGTVTVQSGAFGTPLQPSGILSAASLLSGAIAPGELVTLIGSMIGPPSAQQPAAAYSTVLLGTSVLFDGIAAPLLYAAPDQINAIVPYALSGKNASQLQIVNQRQTIVELPVPVAAATPGIFTLDASGAGPGAILNQDETVNSPSNPAGHGDIISVFGTGAGQTDPPGVDGQITGSVLSVPSLPVSVQIGGRDAETIYAGAAPGLIAGVIQVNTVVPQDAPSGPAVSIVLLVGSLRSAAGVTVALK